MSPTPTAHADKPALRVQDLFAQTGGDPLSNAFARKTAIHPRTTARPVATADMDATWEVIRKEPRTGKSVAYLHIPFCENHCLFCGFYQNPWRTEHSRNYADAIIRELEAGKNDPAQAQGPIHAVYFGGGTPTALDASDLTRIIEAVRENLPLAPDCEITIEGRIYSFGIDKARACFDAGANRISLGVQTFDTQLRRRMGRKVSGEEAMAFLRELSALEQGAIVIDLIFGFPGQTQEMWARDVETAASLDLDGVDLYALNLLPNSPLALSIAKGKLAPQPAQSEMGHYYRLGHEILAGRGWEAISTSHWRRTTRERNLYNLLVKSGANCLAYGAGAGGTLGNVSYRLESRLDTYLETVQSGRKPHGFMMYAPASFDFLKELKAQMEVGMLHVERLQDALASHRFETPAGQIRPLFDQWQESGLLEQSNGWARLTTAGRFWQTTMTQSLLHWIQQNAPARVA
ncbi:heme anaerobic degradation radical SAM methyltransferase ChuW/HutW [Breoghania sp.]|uniref:heme anaerobic degradation radical SAM methyltransferase ChuW/HutW n=1 Tax=Breoghania sp. TaxID=2065378 RepID=UPI002AA836DE|nr:heme anaerobic degradation radical SAM methyltransferase ChuW/HutW [Breoghania sp.]